MYCVRIFLFKYEKHLSVLEIVIYFAQLAKKDFFYKYSVGTGILYKSVNWLVLNRFYPFSVYYVTRRWLVCVIAFIL